MATALLKRPEDDPAYAAGASARNKIGAGVSTLVNTQRAMGGLASLANQAIQAPARAVGSQMEGFSRGLLNMPDETAPAAPAAAAVTPVKPKPAVAAAAPVARAPVVAAPAPPLVVAAPVATPAPTLRPGDPNSITYSPQGPMHGRTVAVPGVATGAAPAMGSVNAQSFGGSAAAAPTAAVVQAEPSRVPTLSLPRTLSGDLSGAEKERQQRLGDIDSAMFALRGNTNSRSKRELYTNLLQMQQQLTNKRIDQVTGLETDGARLDAGAATTQAQLAGQAGEGNANRALRGAEINSDATLRRDALTAQGQQARSTLRGADGNTSLLRNDGSVSTLTDANGQPFREGGLTPKDHLDFLGDQRKALLTDIASNPYFPPEGGDAADPRQTQLATIDAQVNSLLNPGDATAAKGSGQYQEGGIYKDAKGNQARFVNGKWEPIQ